MSKQDRLYRNIGQAVCNIASALIFFAVPITACWLAGYMANII